MVIKKAFKSIS